MQGGEFLRAEDADGPWRFPGPVLSCYEWGSLGPEGESGLP